MSGDPSPGEIRRVLDYIEQEERARQASVTASRTSFFAWMREQGLGYIVGKILDWAWIAVRRLFGF